MLKPFPPSRVKHITAAHIYSRVQCLKMALTVHEIRILLEAGNDTWDMEFTPEHLTHLSQDASYYVLKDMVDRGLLYKRPDKEEFRTTTKLVELYRFLEP
jgi:hypothetical protein